MDEEDEEEETTGSVRDTIRRIYRQMVQIATVSF